MDRAVLHKLSTTFNNLFSIESLLENKNTGGTGETTVVRTSNTIYANKDELYSSQRQRDGWTGPKCQSTYALKSSQLIQQTIPNHLCPHLLHRDPTAILYERPREKLIGALIAVSDLMLPRVMAEENKKNKQTKLSYTVPPLQLWIEEKKNAKIAAVIIDKRIVWLWNTSWTSRETTSPLVYISNVCYNSKSRMPEAVYWVIHAGRIKL